MMPIAARQASDARHANQGPQKFFGAGTAAYPRPPARRVCSMAPGQIPPQSMRRLPHRRRLPLPTAGRECARLRRASSGDCRRRLRRHCARGAQGPPPPPASNRGVPAPPHPPPQGCIGRQARIERATCQSSTARPAGHRFAAASLGRHLPVHLTPSQVVGLSVCAMPGYLLRSGCTSQGQESRGPP